MSRHLLVLVAPFWVVVLLIGSFLPGHEKGELGISTTYSAATRGHVRWQHRLVHFSSFGATALLFVLIARNRRQELLALGGTAVLGISIECTQYLLFHLQGLEWWDIRDDCSAAAAIYPLMQWRLLKAALVRDS